MFFNSDGAHIQAKRPRVDAHCSTALSHAHSHVHSPAPPPPSDPLHSPLARNPCMQVSPTNTMVLMSAPELLRILEAPEHLLFQSSHMGEIQRALDTDHLQDLLTYQDEHNEKFGCYSFPTPFYLARMDDRYALIDGQHRLEAVRRLRYTDQASTDKLLLPVSVFDLRCVEEYDDLFVAINKNKPVRLYSNMQDWKSVLKHLEKFFQTHFRAYLKQTNSPMRPHFNLDNLLQYMDENSLVRKIGLGYEQLVNEIEELNQCYGNHWRELLQRTRYIPNVESHVDKCQSKSACRPFYLGIFQQFEWIDRIAIKVNTPGLTYMKMKHMPKSYRIRVPKPLRKAVWLKRNDNTLDGTCYVCSQKVAYDSFECGHVTAAFKGGDTTLANLEPICKMCNNDMGIDDLEEFKQAWYDAHE